MAALFLVVTIACGVGAVLCAVGATLKFALGIACVGPIVLPSLHQLNEWAVLLAGLAWASTLFMALACALERR